MVIVKKFNQEEINVEILGKQYQVRELSLAEKIKIIGGLGEFVKNLARNAFFKKNENGNIALSFVDEVNFADLNIDKILLGTIEILPEILKLSIPDFKDWDNLPESQSREILLKVLEVNDFKGFIANFFSLGKAIIR